MTGTGTQADPYIPTTLNEFITAVGTAGAYVTLTQDINAANDPEYTGELTTPITWAASVQGGGFTLLGLTLRTSASAIRFAKGITIEAMRLEIAFKRDASFDMLVAYGSGSKPLFSACLFRIKLDESTYDGSFMDELSFQDCAMSISTTAETAANTDFFWICDFLRTTIHFTAEMLRASGASAIIGASCTFVRSAAIFAQLTASEGNFSLVGGGAASDGIRYSYAAILALSGSIAISHYGSSCIIAIDPSASISSIPSGWTRATLAQMKDQDWLTSVGFLP